MNGKNELLIRTAELRDVPALLDIYEPYVRETAITFEYEVPSEAEFARRMMETLRRYPYLVAEEKGAEGEGGTAASVLLGYAYAGPFHARPAYDWAVETSIYVSGKRKHSGVGRKLHDALEEELRGMGILNINACIAVPARAGSEAPVLAGAEPSGKAQLTPGAGGVILSEEVRNTPGAGGAGLPEKMQPAAGSGAACDPYLDRNSESFHAHMGYRLVGEFTKCGYKFGRWYDMVWMEKLIGQHLAQQPPVVPYPAWRQKGGQF